ncbi:Uncharacterised protein [uncultured archaeon]|nr:Uncharacterised protein [uncultured archaeon]
MLPKIFIYLLLCVACMRLWILVLALVVLSTAVLAVNETLCSDTDNGGTHRTDAALKVKGAVTYGITTQSDVCLTSKNGVSTNASIWLKEYFCRQDTRDSDVYDCTSLGYSGCVNGECVGASTGSNATATSQPTVPDSCGNKILEKAKGEQCDPPGSICFGRTSAEYGSCQNDCTCRIAAAALKSLEDQPAVCGDGYKHPSEDCENDSDCSSGYVCSSCNCVKQLTQEEIDALKQSATGVKEEVKANVSKEIDEKYKTAPLPEVNLTATNFTDDAAIQATSSIANFFKKIFGWIAGIFS